jgi:uncharacterized membrane protein
VAFITQQTSSSFPKKKKALFKFFLNLNSVCCSHYYYFLSILFSMANDAALRTSLVWLAVVMVVVGIWTLSFKKVIVTYVLGVLGIAGVLLPDWDYFDRDYSRWFSFVSEQDKLALALRSGFRLVN